MKKAFLTGLAMSAIGLALAAPAHADDHGGEMHHASQSCGAIVPPGRVPAIIDTSTASAAEIGCAAADWQLEARRDLSYLGERLEASSYGRGWVTATFFVGLDHFAATLGDETMLRYVRQYALDNGMEIGDRPWHGDDQLVAAIYAAIALREDKPEMMNKSLEVFDHIIEQNYTTSLEFVDRNEPGKEGACQKRWCWADALFMAPPSWALATQTSGDPKYADYAAKETRAVIEYLQDPTTGLMFRDSRYFDLKTPNGKPVFWSRGNGWVFAGLARFIDALPADHPEMPLMKETFVTLADALVEIQREDGYWPTSLMDPEYLTNPETSGTAFYGFGLAWGLNNGMLEGEKFELARDKAWDAIREATFTSGKVGWVQQIGKDPQSTDRETSHLYAVGGTLLFAAEMHKAEQE